jgi:hypothetical protein
MQKSLPGNHRCKFSFRKIVFIVLTAVLISSTLPISMALENTTTIPGKGTILYAAHKRPYVDGKILRHPTGEIFNIIAVYKMRSLTYYPGGISGWTDEADAVYDIIKASGANTVFLALNKWLWDNDPQYKPGIDALVAKCKARGLYAVMNYHTNTQGGDRDADYYALPIDVWRNFMVEIATRYKDEPTVIGIDPVDEGQGVAEAEWRSKHLDIIDAIHAVDPSYLVIVGPCPRLTLKNFSPYNRSNIIYKIHHFYSWDVGYGGYADAYYSAETEEDFKQAYELMRSFYQEILTNFQDTYNVPVGEATSIGKVANHLSGQPPLRNNYRQWDDQMKLTAELGFGHTEYFACDRDFPTALFWNLLDANDPTQLSEAGLVWNASLQYFVYMP